MINKNNYLESVYFRRRSIRKFLPTPVEEEKIQLLIKGFFQVESAKNQMPGEIIIIKDLQKIKKIAEKHNSRSIIEQAPLLFFITSRDNYQVSPTLYYLDQDLGAATHQILLMAEDLELGALWCGINMNNHNSFAEILNLPTDVRIISLICIGYKNEEKPSNDKYFSEKVHYEEW